tara:strand:- start:1211 stop:1882 length:672 start_codon:yes stop_codon:yes gene_type:complete
MKIMCFTYRDWAKKIYSNLDNEFKGSIDFIHINSKDEYSEETINKENPDLILWYGWSWIIPSSITNNFFSVMLHPSPLPKYRGGSPIQNQIINGETQSAVSLFKIDEGMDTGDIIYQKSFSLLGDLDDILQRITKIGTELSINMIKNFEVLELEQQNHNISSSFKRRKPSQSKINHEDFENFTATELYNKIRALQDPYPNAFIECKDGTKLYLTKAHINDSKK